MFHLRIGTRNKTVLNDQFGNNVFHLQIGTRNKTVLNDQFGNNVFHSQIAIRNKTVLNDQFGNNVFHSQIGIRNKTVLNDQFGNNVFYLQIGTRNKTVLIDQFGNNVFHLQLGTSSETQGQLVGAGKSLNGREKNSGEEKSRTTRRAPGDKVLTDQFQMAWVILASDWCHKTFVFCAQSQSSKTRSRFVSSYTNHTYRPVARHICLGRSPRVYSRRKVPITAQNVAVIFRHIRTKLA